MTSDERFAVDLGKPPAPAPAEAAPVAGEGDGDGVRFPVFTHEALYQRIANHVRELIVSE